MVNSVIGPEKDLAAWTFLRPGLEGFTAAETLLSPILNRQQ
jgi:hypothetical protein